MSDRSTAAAERVMTIAAYAIGTLLLSWVAVANGFPLFFSDSGTYLRVGTEIHFPPDRPISYGLFLMPFTRLFGGLGLWLAMFAQGLFTTWLIDRTLALAGGRSSPAMLLLTVILLAFFSSLPWFTGQLMPDLATGLMGLVFCLMLVDDQLGRFERKLMPAILCGLIAVHLSHIAVAASLIVFSALMLRWMGLPLAGVVRAAGSLFAALIILCGFNYVGAGKFTPSLESESFVLARLLDAKIAQGPLAETCESTDMKICSIGDIVDAPDKNLPGQAYLWDKASPRTELEGANADAHRAEEAAIIKQTFASNPVGVIGLVVKSWGRQIVTARTGDGLVKHGPEMQIHRQIRLYFPGSLSAWEASRQQNWELQPLLFVSHPLIALGCAILLPVPLAVAWRRRDSAFVVTMATISATLLANAAVCGNLSGVFDRYQSRVLWLIPLLLILACWRCWCQRGGIATRQRFLKRSIRS